MTKKVLLTAVSILAAVNVVLAIVWLSSRDSGDPYSGGVDMPPVFTSSGLSQRDAMPAAKFAVDMYQRGWYHLVQGKQITDISDLGPVKDTASITDFPVIQRVNGVVFQSNNFVGPKRVVDAVYVTKNKAGDFVATACEFQSPEEIRVITAKGVADTLEGVNGWRVTIDSAGDGMYMKEVVGNSETCKKVKGLLK